MKKVLSILAVLVILIAGGAWYLLSGAGDFIHTQILLQGSKYIGTTVSVTNVELALTEGRMTISGLDIKNPQGFSSEDAFSVDEITLDLGEVVTEPYVIQTIKINAPEMLYEVDANGQGNLIMLKNNLTKNLPTTKNEPISTSKNTASPLIILDNVTVSDVRLKLNFEKLPTGELNIDTKAYEVTLPTFNARAIGQPNGMPADQVGIAVVNAMLDNVIAAAKIETQKRLTEMAKQKAKKELEKQKGKLLEKANDKLKGLVD